MFFSLFINDRIGDKSFNNMVSLFNNNKCLPDALFTASLYPLPKPKLIFDSIKITFLKFSFIKLQLSSEELLSMIIIS